MSHHLSEFVEGFLAITLRALFAGVFATLFYLAMCLAALEWLPIVWWRITFAGIFAITLAMALVDWWQAR